MPVHKPHKYLDMKVSSIFFKLILSYIFLLCGSTIYAQTYIPGNIYYDATGFVEYRPGTLPIIISTPHGGGLEPDTIPDRSYGTLVKDGWTQTIGRRMYDAIYDQTGCYPHLINNLLHRKKFDANRDLAEAADGNPTVEQAWYNYHAFIDLAKDLTIQKYNRGLFLDLHGHGHTIQRVELGYLLSGAELRLSDATLNTITYIEESSIRTLVGDNVNGHTHAELLRGTNSFGTLLDNAGFASVPSINDPAPAIGDAYFSGGYNTVRHGSRDNGGNIDAIQIEMNRQAREFQTQAIAEALATTAKQYMDYQYDEQCLIQLSPKVFLQGAINGILMDDNLRTNNILPSTEPYTARGITGIENANSSVKSGVFSVTGNDAIVDWVVVELRDATTPSTILSRRAALLQRDGDVVDVDGVTTVPFTKVGADNYHVSILHRNHLGVMSGTAIPLSH